MALVLAWIAALAPIIVPLARRVLVGLGVTAVTFVGVGALWDAAQDAIWTSLGSVSSTILTILGMARIDDGIKVVLSAGTAKLLLRGLNAATGAMTNWGLGRFID